MPKGLRDPLTAEQLREIGLRRDPADIIPLLWEIKRLRATVLRADQVMKSVRPGEFIADVFRKELEEEPAVQEFERIRSGLNLNERPDGSRQSNKR
ncbi:hypothetical protein GTP46_24495 [Duganella sp. FT135W]|uniref:Uncharacterized protein n=1 Tax=Duganella flavida TaxID=2692175 RepID=A0A6L8KJ70_9BURK|nr:hypothetical protein [Duganella flavida]MYM25792.1 hypothetical protein [Duganella flavida]